VKTTLRRSIAPPRARKVLSIAASIVLLAGCAGRQVQLAPKDRIALAGEPHVHAVHHATPRTFGVESSGYTAAAVLLTPLVGAAMALEGRALQRDLKLEDPVVRVRDRLASAFQASFKLGNLRIVPQAAQADDLEALKKQFQTGVVLDVRTAGWGIDNDRAKYSGRARLVRLSDSTILWQGTCKVVAGKDQPSPGREALVANEGAMLKAKLLEAADGCADQLAGWAIETDR
jgi:ABC-type uncharacterized transport system auxiliary subunit